MAQAQAHNHDHPEPMQPTPSRLSAVDRERVRQLKWALGLIGFTLAVEVVGGILARSLALLSDAAHLFSDIASLGLALTAIVLAGRPPTDARTYGLHRLEVMAAVVNGLLLLGIVGAILFEAYRRVFLHEGHEVHTGLMLGVGIFGLVINVVVLSRLRGHSHGDLNIRSAYLHVMGDLLGSVGVVGAAIIIGLTGLQIVDPVLSVAIALVILVSAVRVLRDAGHILLEGVPAHVDINEVAEALRRVEGVLDVHHLHAWSLCSHVHAISVHVVATPEDENDRCRLRARLEEMFAHFGFSETTVEIEGRTCPLETLVQAAGHGADYEHPADHFH